MGTRKAKTAAALSAGTPAGWQAQLGAAPPSPAQHTPRGRRVRKTSLMTDDLIARVESFAAQHGVGINEGLRFILLAGFDALDAGNVKVDTQVITRRTLGV